jgi:CubicO group peptidase (beta-lactamase class C family)
LTARAAAGDAPAVAEIQGTYEQRFKGVRDALSTSLDGEDIGASAAVFVDGEPVVDIWGGHLDAGRNIPWQSDTITNVWSTTKTMMALCALILADRGELDFSAPVARYWPQFAANGKEGVLVRHALSHTAGLPDFDRPVSMTDLYDWPKITALLAAQAPVWEPGKLAGYHSVTEGFIIGEIVARITGRSLGTFFAEEVAGPLGADFHMGLPPEHDHRVAPLLPPPESVDGDLQAAAPAQQMPGLVVNEGLRLSDGNTVAFRRAHLPFGGGFGNARSVAAVQSVLANGGEARGVRLLSREGCEVARQEQYRGIDQVLGSSMRYGMGYALNDRACFWGGWGGSVVLVDLDKRMSVSYVMNRMLDRGRSDVRALSIILAAYEGLG